MGVRNARRLISASETPVSASEFDSETSASASETIVSAIGTDAEMAVSDAETIVLQAETAQFVVVGRFRGDTNRITALEACRKCWERIKVNRRR